MSPLPALLRAAWPTLIHPKAAGYIGHFFDCDQREGEIRGRVSGNHGVYTVSIRVDGRRLSSGCSCHVGGGGGCHHVQALAHSFLAEPDGFEPRAEPPDSADIETLANLQAYLEATSLEQLLKRLRNEGGTQKAFAAAISMSPRHLGTINRSEKHNRFFHELGATKLTALWILENNIFR